jgi:hypothetical protein
MHFSWLEYAFKHLSIILNIKASKTNGVKKQRGSSFASDPFARPSNEEIAFSIDEAKGENCCG